MKKKAIHAEYRKTLESFPEWLRLRNLDKTN